VLAEFPFVGIEELADHLLRHVAAEFGERRRAHRARTARDVRTQFGQRHRPLPSAFAHAIDRRDHVRRAVEQGAVEVEQRKPGEMPGFGTRDPGPEQLPVPGPWSPIHAVHGFTAQAR